MLRCVHVYTMCTQTMCTQTSYIKQKVLHHRITGFKHTYIHTQIYTYSTYCKHTQIQTQTPELRIQTHVPHPKYHISRLFPMEEPTSSSISYLVWVCHHCATYIFITFPVTTSLDQSSTSVTGRASGDNVWHVHAALTTLSY